MSLERFRELCNKSKFYFFNTLGDFDKKIDWNGLSVKNIKFERGILGVEPKEFKMVRKEQPCCKEFKQEVRGAIVNFIERLDKQITHYPDMPRCPNCRYNFNDKANSGQLHQKYILQELLKELRIEE